MLAFCVAFGGSRMLFAAAVFTTIVHRTVRAGKLAIDFGVWVMIYMVVFRALSKGVRNQPSRE